MAILYDWYENPGESDDSEEKGLHPRIFSAVSLQWFFEWHRGHWGEQPQ